MVHPLLSSQQKESRDATHHFVHITLFIYSIFFKIKNSTPKAKIFLVEYFFDMLHGE